MIILLLFGIALFAVLRGPRRARRRHRRACAAATRSRRSRATGSRDRSRRRHANGAGSREVLDSLATVLGTIAVRRFASMREQEMRKLLRSAGLYQMHAETFVGYRLLAAGGIPAALAAACHSARAGSRPEASCSCASSRRRDGSCPRSSSSGGARSASTRSTSRCRSSSTCSWYDGRGRRRLRGRAAARRAPGRRAAGPRAPDHAAGAEHGPDDRERSAEHARACRERLRASVRASDDPGAESRRLDRQDPARPRGRHAQAPATDGGGAGAKGADEDPLPARLPHSPGALHHRARRADDRARRRRSAPWRKADAGSSAGAGRGRPVLAGGSRRPRTRA